MRVAVGLASQVLHLATGDIHKNWKAVRAHLRNAARPLTDKLGTLALLDVRKNEAKDGKYSGKKQPKATLVFEDRWNYVSSILFDVNLEQLALRSPVPIQILVRWIKVAQQCANISMAVAGEQDSTYDPRAQKVFDAIDTDRDGVLSTEEVMAFLLKSFGNGPALKLLRVLDTNLDGSISAEEWHKGWRLGEFDVEMGTDDPGDGGDAPALPRLLSKHLTKSHLFESETDGSERKLKKKASSKKQVLPPDKTAEKASSKKQVLPPGKTADQTAAGEPVRTGKALANDHLAAYRARALAEPEESTTDVEHFESSSPASDSCTGPEGEVAPPRESRKSAAELAREHLQRAQASN